MINGDLLVFLATFLVVVRGGHCNYAFPQGTSTFTDFSAHQVWTRGPVDNVFGSMQYWFEDGQGGYMGGQFHSDGTQSVLFSVWDSDSMPYSAMPMGDCTRFGGEVAGAHCLIKYNLHVTTEYIYTVSSDGTNATGAFWSGKVTNKQTGEVTKMGTIFLYNVRGLVGFGHLKPAAASFIEYYTGGSFYSAYGWIGPYGNGESVVVESARSDEESHVSVSDCIPSFGCGHPNTYYEEGANITTTPAHALWSLFGSTLGQSTH